MQYKWKDLFGDEESNALYNAIHKAAFEAAEGKGIDPAASQQEELAAVYDFVEQTPRTSLTAEIIDALHGLGYKIVKAPPA